MKKSSAVFRYWRWLHTNGFASGYLKNSFINKLTCVSPCHLFKDLLVLSIQEIFLLIILTIVMFTMVTLGNAVAILILIIGWTCGYGPNRVKERMFREKQTNSLMVIIPLFPVMLLLSNTPADATQKVIPGMRKLEFPRIHGKTIYPAYIILGIASVILGFGIITSVVHFFSALEFKQEAIEIIGYFEIVITAILALTLTFFTYRTLWRSSFGRLMRTYIKDRWKGLCRKIEFVDE